jgi:hypothetical protein
MFEFDILASAAKRSAIALLMAAAGTAQAAPYTVYFTGTTLTQYDYATDEYLAPGATFSGHVTFDVALAESTFADATREIAFGDLGCSQVLFGSCAKQWGSEPSVVTDYRLTLGSITYLPLESVFTPYGTARRQNTSLANEEWMAFAYQSQMENSGTSARFLSQNMSQSLLLSASGGSGLLADTFRNLDQGFDLSAVPIGQSNVRFVSESYSWTCTSADGCGTFNGWGANSVEMTGTLTSARFEPGTNGVPAEIPEPGVLTLSALGMALLLTVRRRTPRRT